MELANDSRAVRIMLLVGGPATEGAGKVVGRELKVPIRQARTAARRTVHMQRCTCALRTSLRQDVSLRQLPHVETEPQGRSLYGKPAHVDMRILAVTFM